MKKNKVAVKLIITCISLIIIITLILTTMARYESQGDSIGEIEVALYVLNADYQSMNLKLDNMIPKDQPYIHNFSVSNYNDTERTDVELEYTLSIRTTTNLPLTYELYLNENYNAPSATNIITQNTIEADSDGTYFRTITTDTKTFGYIQNETNIYQLLVYFPTTYSSVQYQDIVESIEIIINSRQVIN